MTQSPLAARAVALAALQRILDNGQYLDEAFAAALRLQPGMAARDRAFARLLVITVLRRLGEIDSRINGFLDAPEKLASDARHILRLGAAQLLYLGTPPHAVVDTAVGLAGSDRDSFVRRAKGLVNAVLRRIADEGPRPLPPALNLPDWLLESWSDRFGPETATAIAAAQLGEPPLDLTLKPDADREALVAELTSRQIDVMTSPSGGLRLEEAGIIEDLPGFAEGLWWVQDAAAALPAQLLGVKAGERVLDLCAAPGGKTAQLAAAGAEVTALDLAPKRLKRLQENLDRLGLTAELVAADGRKYRPEPRFDHVLLDAPCSATGTLRRHPDVGWLKSPEDVQSLVLTQQALFAAAAHMVAPGGRLLYCVCSMEAAEGPDQVSHFLQHHKDFALEPVTGAELPGLEAALLPDGTVQTLPSQNVDGFYIARLRHLP
ncbi:16S rRNA (cytosine(967)-C(5))-methyltransferase RsmB [Govanella unica]|uniref:16S rRNA (cytosine(967)-C(5))-methyltransferase n=1 Tax=Govanella unica TaxID=2975056 RepID=A0A9X3Z5Q3_9PROT|nr:16S rRNA (cytosine(967)-C(5))-methyltransferase RsmB [Govania unica]MDA5192405.1 16S rRNA (cytosine(967)-C(5))-methyltransferase RsmB [Govania unica]